MLMALTSASAGSPPSVNAQSGAQRVLHAAVEPAECIRDSLLATLSYRPPTIRYRNKQIH